MIQTAMLKVLVAYHMLKRPQHSSNAEGEGLVGLNSEKKMTQCKVDTATEAYGYHSWLQKFTEETGLKLDSP